jgi:hypothetical protein
MKDIRRNYLLFLFTRNKENNPTMADTIPNPGVFGAAVASTVVTFGVAVTATVVAVTAGVAVTATVVVVTAGVAGNFSA